LDAVAKRKRPEGVPARDGWYQSLSGGESLRREPCSTNLQGKRYPVPYRHSGHAKFASSVLVQELRGHGQEIAAPEYVE
jgi:hypothetical protein